MRAWLLTSALFLPLWAQARPVTLQVGQPHTPSMVYGPADMLCDLHKCRLFNLPPAVEPVANTIVEFGLPEVTGQDAVEFHRCFALCRASVLGYESNPTSKPEQSNPTVFITAIEIRLD